MICMYGCQLESWVAAGCSPPPVVACGDVGLLNGELSVWVFCHVGEADFAEFRRGWLVAIHRRRLQWVFFRFEVSSNPKSRLPSANLSSTSGRPISSQAKSRLGYTMLSRWMWWGRKYAIMVLVTPTFTVKEPLPQLQFEFLDGQRHR